MYTPTTAFPDDLSRTEEPSSYPSSREHSVKRWGSNKTYRQPIIRRQTDSQKGTTSGSNSICDTGVTSSKTTGPTSYQSPNSHTTPGLMHLQSTHHSSCSWGANQGQHGRKEQRSHRQWTNDCNR